jgi:hypothetical protein
MNITFPTISSSNLEGKKFELPQDFKGKLNIILIAFQREQQDLVEEWLPFLDDLARKTPDIAFYELPTLNISYILVRRVIDGGMQAGIPDINARERTITLYLNKKTFRKELDIPDEKTIYILLINKKGEVIWRTQGRFTNEKSIDLENTVKKNLQKNEPV